MCTKHVQLNKKAPADEAGAETGAVEGTEGAGNVAGNFPPRWGNLLCFFFLNPEFFLKPWIHSSFGIFLFFHRLNQLFAMVILLLVITLTWIHTKCL